MCREQEIQKGKDTGKKLQANRKVIWLLDLGKLYDLVEKPSRIWVFL